MRPLITCSIYCTQNNSILLLKRNKNPFKGYWVAPGGKVEAKESPYQAAMRELLEETGLIAKDLKLRGIITETSPVTEWQFLIFYYVTKNFKGKICKNCQEGELRWWPISKLAQAKIPEADQSFMYPILDMDSPVFEAKYIYDQNLNLIKNYIYKVKNNWS